MNKDAKKLIEELLSIAWVTINGNKPYDIKVHNDNFYERVIKEESLGLGESYMEGWWDCDSVDELINKILRAKLDKKVAGNWKIKLHYLKARLFNLQKDKKSFNKLMKHHYNLGNDLFKAMLDKRMNYSSAYWKNAKNLDEAQEAKLELICKKLVLKEGMSVLDLGCGWGGFAKYAAEKYGVKVVGVTISKEHYELGKELVKGFPVEIKLQDYREVTGKFDRVISIGSIEHVGYKNYRTYMEVVNRTLKDDGISLIHTIGSNKSQVASNAWITKYIFPVGLVPSVAQLSKAMEGIFVFEDLQNFGPDYDKTLTNWYKNFKNAWPKLKNKYVETFYRMWKYYLLSSAGGFRSRQTQLWQIVMTKPGRELPLRIS